MDTNIELAVMHALPRDFNDPVELIWVHAFPFKSYTHPVYGTVEFTQEKAEQMLANYNANVVGMELTADYEHGLDPAKGKKAAGTFKEVEIRDDGLWVGVEPTSEAVAEIRDGAWKYFSVSYHDEWEHPETKEVHKNVLYGGGLTNHPYLKGVAPVNYSELAAEVADLEHAEPGSGNPPEPRERESEPVVFQEGLQPEDDPQHPEGSKEVDEKELREKLGIGDDEDIMESLDSVMADAKAFSESKAEERKAMQFAEAFPEEARRLQELAEKDRVNDAKSFADSFTDIEQNGRRYSVAPVVREKLEGAHKKFSEGALSPQEFSEVVGEVVKQPLVELSERGNAVDTEDKEAEELVKEFTDLVQTKIKEADDKMSFGDAVSLAARENPDGFKAYRDAVPTRR